MKDLTYWRNTAYYYLFGIELATYWTSALVTIACVVAALISLATESSIWAPLHACLVFFYVGLQGIWAATGYLVYPKETSTLMQWPSSGYQYEAGALHLGLGLIALASPLFTGFALAAGLMAVIVNIGSIYAHTQHYSSHTSLISWWRQHHTARGPMLYAAVGSTILLIISTLLK